MEHINIKVKVVPFETCWLQQKSTVFPLKMNIFCLPCKLGHLFVTTFTHRLAATVQKLVGKHALFPPSGWQMVADWYVFCCQGRALTLIERGGNRGAKYSQRHYPFTSFKGKKLPNIVQYNSGLVLKSKQMFLMQGTQKLPIFTFTCFLLSLLLLLLCLCV